ncbi:hypothetical protein GCM10008914_01430 [Clostridium tertium]
MKIIFQIVKKFTHICILEKGRVDPIFSFNLNKNIKIRYLIWCIEDIIEFSRGDKYETYKK